MNKKEIRIILEDQENDFIFKKSKSNLDVKFNRIAFIFFVLFIISLIYSIHLMHLGSRKIKTDSQSPSWLFPSVAYSPQLGHTQLGVWSKKRNFPIQNQLFWSRKWWFDTHWKSRNKVFFWLIALSFIIMPKFAAASPLCRSNNIEFADW